MSEDAIWCSLAYVIGCNYILHMLENVVLTQ
jgi:hypothetical protein